MDTERDIIYRRQEAEKVARRRALLAKMQPDPKFARQVAEEWKAVREWLARR